MNSGLSQNSLNWCWIPGVGTLVSGRQIEDVDEAEGTKKRSGKDKKGSLTHPPITGLVNSFFWTRGEHHLWSVLWTILKEESFAISGLNNYGYVYRTLVKTCFNSDQEQAVNLNQIIYKHWSNQMTWEYKVISTRLVFLSIWRGNGS